MSVKIPESTQSFQPKVVSDFAFLTAMAVIAGFYILMILALIVADATCGPS